MLSLNQPKQVLRPRPEVNANQVFAYFILPRSCLIEMCRFKIILNLCVVRRAAQKAVKRVKLRGSDDSSEFEDDSDFEGSALSSSASEEYASDHEASDDEEFRESSEPESDGMFHCCKLNHPI